jgi:hypothetical protein
MPSRPPGSQRRRRAPTRCTSRSRTRLASSAVCSALLLTPAERGLEAIAPNSNPRSTQRPGSSRRGAGSNRKVPIQPPSPRAVELSRSQDTTTQRVRPPPTAKAPNRTRSLRQKGLHSKNERQVKRNEHLEVPVEQSEQTELAPEAPPQATGEQTRREFGL